MPEPTETEHEIAVRVIVAACVSQHTEYNHNPCGDCTWVIMSVQAAAAKP